MNNNTITSPKGFLAIGLGCGIKQSGKPDLALLCCPDGAAAAAMFTTNKIVSAAVLVCKEHFASAAKVGAVVVNSGNANACTGAKGLAAAKAMCAKTAKELAIKPEQVLLASTGIIGHQLPIKKIAVGIAVAAKKLSASPAAGLAFCRAIMTTDTRPKYAVSTVKISGKTVRIAGAVKGAGMIGPNLATTIAVLTTDAAITKPMLRRAFKNAVGNSLNKLTVDGHQSTNDTAIILASGKAGNKLIAKPNAGFGRFEKALCEICTDLVCQMALDAEGATRMFTVIVQNAASKQQAQQAARAVADYDLVKCAVHGADPNWGRIICAVGSAGVKLNPDKISCKIGSATVFKNGKPAKFDPKKVSRIIAGKHHTIIVSLGAGKSRDFCCGCDLSAKYVSINADYHT